MANYWKKNLFLLSLGPLSILLAWALGFVPNPRPLYRGIGGGTSNGMNYWEHIKRMYGNQTRPDFCLIQNAWGDDGPFPLTCYQSKEINQQKNLYQVIECWIPKKAFSLDKIEEQITFPCNVFGPELTLSELKQTKGIIDMDRYERFYGDEDLLTIEKIQINFRESYRPLFIISAILSSFFSATVATIGITRHIVIGLERVFNLISDNSKKEKRNR